VSWARLEAEAPELASLARERLGRRLVLLGTVRADGSPRISPIEIFVLGDELVLGAMRRSAKARDLRRDPRIAAHSPVVEPDGGAPELKLYGRVVPADVDAGWWRSRRESADVYRLELDEAVHVEWNLAASTMVVRRWKAGSAESVSERPYP
jgi:hypothetical protein